METWKHRDREFVIFRLPYEHYASIHLYYSEEYIIKFGGLEEVEYLKKNPKVEILILEEGECDDYQRNPLIKTVTKYRKTYNLTNHVYILYQGYGQENYIATYLRTVPNFITLVRSVSAPYNFCMNWTKVHSNVHDAEEKLKTTYTKKYFLEDIKIEKAFLILAGKSRVSRLLFLDKLLKTDLLDNTYYSFNNEYLKLDKDVIKKFMDQGWTYREIINNHHGKSEAEFLRNHNLLISEEELTTVRHIHKNILPLFNLPRKTDDYYYDPWWIIPEPELYKSIAVDIVNETFHHRGIVANNLFKNINFFTEKITKPILAFRPFMVLGNRFYLRDLKNEFGYKSFGDYWDEGYDDSHSAQAAYDIAIENMKYLNSLTTNQLQNMLIDMKDILVHNSNIAKRYFMRGEAWKRDVKKYLDGKGVAWTGTKGNMAF
jgi:hypothetical protein